MCRKHHSSQCLCKVNCIKMSTNGSSLKQKLKNFRKAVTCVSRNRSPRRSQEFDKQIEECRNALTEFNVLRKQEEYQKKIEKYKQENLLLKEEFKLHKALSEEYQKELAKENNLLKNEIKVKQVQIEKVEEEKMLIKQEYQMKELHIKEESEKIVQETACELEQKILKFKQDLTTAQEQIAKNVFVNDKHEALNFVRDSTVLMQEVESLKIVLDLKQTEIKEMRIALAGLKQKEQALKVAEDRIGLMRTRNEDLQEQLRRKARNEQNLEKEILRLRNVVLDKNSENKKLSFQNEELLWKLQYGENVVKETLPNSQSEQHPQTLVDNSTVKSVLTKPQSVAYTLDLYDEPDIIKKRKTVTFEESSIRKSKS